MTNKSVVWLLVQNDGVLGVFATWETGLAQLQARKSEINRSALPQLLTWCGGEHLVDSSTGCLHTRLWTPYGHIAKLALEPHYLEGAAAPWAIVERCGHLEDLPADANTARDLQARQAEERQAIIEIYGAFLNEMFPDVHASGSGAEFAQAIVRECRARLAPPQCSHDLDPQSVVVVSAVSAQDGLQEVRADVGHLLTLTEAVASLAEISVERFYALLEEKGERIGPFLAARLQHVLQAKLAVRTTVPPVVAPVAASGAVADAFDPLWTLKEILDWELQLGGRELRERDIKKLGRLWRAAKAEEAAVRRLAAEKRRAKPKRNHLRKAKVRKVRG